MLVFFAAFGHAPQFADTFPMRLKHDADISQVTYFKKHELQGLYISNPEDGKLAQASFPTDTPDGTLYVGCVANEHVTPSAATMKSADGTVEPFTQSTYHLKYDSTIPTCAATQGFAIYGQFNGPWAAVVGKKESFSVVELLSFPVYTAKLHGSWWNDHYVYHWWFLAAVVVTLISARWTSTWPRILVASLFLASAFDRFSHAFTLGVFVVAAVADGIPALLVMLPKRPAKWGWIAFCVLVAVSVGMLSNWWVPVLLLLAQCFDVTRMLARPIACMLFVGSGYLVAPLALLGLTLYTIAVMSMGTDANPVTGYAVGDLEPFIPFRDIRVYVT